MDDAFDIYRPFPHELVPVQDESPALDRFPALDLPSALDLRAAPDLAALLLAHRGNDIALNGSAVRHLGGQCLQVLVSAQRTWAMDGRTFHLLAASPELQAGVALLGATKLLPVENPL